MERSGDVTCWDVLKPMQSRILLEITALSWVSLFCSEFFFHLSFLELSEKKTHQAYLVSIDTTCSWYVCLILEDPKVLSGFCPYSLFLFTFRFWDSVFISLAISPHLRHMHCCLYTICSWCLIDIKCEQVGPGDKAQQLRAPVCPVEDLGSTASTYLAAHSHM